MSHDSQICMSVDILPASYCSAPVKNAGKFNCRPRKGNFLSSVQWYRAQLQIILTATVFSHPDIYHPRLIFFVLPFCSVALLCMFIKPLWFFPLLYWSVISLICILTGSCVALSLVSSFPFHQSLI